MGPFLRDHLGPIRTEHPCKRLFGALSHDIFYVVWYRYSMTYNTMSKVDLLRGASKSFITHLEQGLSKEETSRPC